MEKPNQSVTVAVPRIFWEDHVDRDLPGGTVVRETKLQVTVRLTEDEFRELLSDARYYASGMFKSDYLASVVRSAKRTVKALESSTVARLRGWTR